MSRVLVAGASNQIGAYLLPRLLSAGIEVEAVARRARPAWVQAHPKLNWRQADLSDAHAPAAGPNRLIWLAPMALLPAALERLGPDRVVLVSSTSRYTKQDSPDHQERTVAAVLRDGEQALKDFSAAAGAAVTILRPTLIYGAGMDQNLTRIAALVERYRVAVIAGRGGGLRQPVHADDVADAIVRVLDQPLTHGRDYDLSGGSTLSYREMVAAVFESLGRRPRIVRLPGWLLRPLAAVGGRLPMLRGLSPQVVARMERDLVFEHQRAAADFGYQPRQFRPTRRTWEPFSSAGHPAA